MNECCKANLARAAEVAWAQFSEDAKKAEEQEAKGETGGYEFRVRAQGAAIVATALESFATGGKTDG